MINRLGFNNEGHEAALRRLTARSGRTGIVGVNIGANKDSADRIADYEEGVRRFAPLASYLTVNISSPNTPGLRNMQARESLAELLSRVIAARAAASSGGRKCRSSSRSRPTSVKREIEDVAAEVLEKKIDGVIVSNTTLSRDGLRIRGAYWRDRRPLRQAAVRALDDRCSQRSGSWSDPTSLMVGVGGVDSAETAIEKIRAGADFVQLYTGMIYAGPSLPGRIVRGMASALERDGGASVRDLRDSRLDHWAAQPL